MRGGSPPSDLTDAARSGGPPSLRDTFARMPSWYRNPDAPAPNVPRKVGITAVIERDGRFLVERRADDADVWAFIGGSLEDDEPVLDTLRREVREETGYTVYSARLLGVFSDPSRIVKYPDGTTCRVLSIAFRATVGGDADPRLSSESAGMRFVTHEELQQLPFWAIHVPIRDALLSDPDGIVVA
jgi:ADP-ribose pyrophosphatase YjhB (NUDIX family)